MGDRIKGDTSVAEDSAFRLGNFRINGKKIEVPLQALDLKKKYLSKIDFPDKDVGVYEVYKTYSHEKFNNFKTIPSEKSKHDRELKLLKEAAKNENAPKFLFARFTGKNYPTEEEVEQLISITYTFSDATPIPALPDIFKETVPVKKRNGEMSSKVDQRISKEKFERYLDFMGKYIDSLNLLNHKDILGIIPLSLESAYIRELIAFYYSKGVNHFYIDFYTREFSGLINSPTIYSILAEFKKQGLEYQKTFIYSINGSPGRFTENDSVISSKDIITGGAGIDCIGRLHLGIGKKKEGAIDPRILEKQKFNKIRLFNKEDYGYYRLDSKDIPFSMPKDSITTNELLTDINKGKKFADIFNMHQLGLENKNLHSYLEDKNPLGIIEKQKNKVSKLDLNSIRKFRTDQKIKGLI